MALTFGDIQTEVLAYGFSAASYQTRVKRWLNEANHRLARRALLPENQETRALTTTAGNNAVSISGTRTVYAVEEVTITTDNSPLTPVEYKVWVQLASASGTPTHYSAPNNTALLLWPTPNSTYGLQVILYSDPADMVDDAEALDIPDLYADGLVSYAVAKCYLAEDDPQMYQTHMENFKHSQMELSTDEPFIQREGPRQVPGMWSTGAW